MQVMEPVTVIGSYLSPYVRKVLVCLELKSIPYRIDPIVPFFGNEAFSRLSPLRRIPVLIDRDLTLCDSTIICEYLDEQYPRVPVYPAAPQARASCRWIEEYADSRMGEVFIWHYFNQLIIRRAVWGEGPDEAVVTRAVSEEIPSILDYLEAEVRQTGFLFDEARLMVADIAVAAMFRNAGFARFSIDAGRWPRLAAYAARVLASPSFVALSRYEALLLRAKIADHRSVLTEAGAPLTATTWGTGEAQRGVMSI